MTETILGTGAFAVLVLFEIQKCRSTRQNTTAVNPWFLLGCLLLTVSLVVRAVNCGTASGLQVVAGTVVLAAGMVFYASVLGVALGAKQQGYLRDRAESEVSRQGMYAKVRHPGVWSFLVCAAGYGLLVPRGLGLAMWLTLLNLGYTVLQDRYFFPVYLKGYEAYKKEVPFFIPRRR